MKTTDIHCDTIRVSGALYERARDVPMGIWQPYAIAWTGTTTHPAIGNGTIAADYALVGMTCHVRIALTWGSTTTPGAGTYRLTLPHRSSAHKTAVPAYLNVQDRFYTGGALLVAVPGELLHVVIATPSGARGVLWAPGEPNAMVAGDQLIIAGVFEVNVIPPVVRAPGDPEPDAEGQ
jgi:hypothetical protein